MQSYERVESQEDMDFLLASIAGFHDSMTKEIHLMNRGYVRADKSMMMSHRFDAQILIQSQWKPFALELLFVGVRELCVDDPGEYWGASGSVEIKSAPVETRRIAMKFDSALRVMSESLYYKVRTECLGVQAFLKSEVPSPDAVPASPLEDKWRQCSGCCNAWECEPTDVFSYCPSCGQLTEIRPVDERFNLSPKPGPPVKSHPRR